MSVIESALSEPFFRALGWTLIHFVWQGALVAALYAGVRIALRGTAPGLRYAAACSAMLLMLAFPAATLYFASYSPAGAAPEATAERREQGRAAGASKAAGTTPLRVSGPGDVDPDEVLPPEAAWSRGRAEDSYNSLLAWLVALWLAGSLALTLRFLLGWRRAHGLRRLDVTPAGEEWQAVVARLCLRLRVSRPVRLCLSALVEVPAVVGWLRPVILVPAGVLTGLTPAQVEALLAHELAHVRRHDYLVNLVQTAAETLLFYHPAVWWVSREIRAEREHCCDDAAVGACGDVVLYARALTALEQLRAGRERLAIAATGGPLLKRIRRLLESPDPTAVHHSPWFAGFVVALAALGVMAGARGTLLYGEAASPYALGPPTYAKTERQVAVTFYSLPYLRHYRADHPSAEENTRQLLTTLTANNIPAVGFVGERSLYKGGGSEPLTAPLKMWLDAGLELGTQTYSHRWLYNTPVEEYREDIVRGEAVTRRLMKERGQTLRYFLYPFLNTGPDLETKASVEKFLKERGLVFAPVTIDNDDWIFAKAYDEATERGDLETARRISDEYVPYMEKVFEFYEKLSADVLGYEAPQVLMLGANRLNAERLPDLVSMMKRRGYSFVTLEAAMKDKAFAQPDTFTGPVGISWLQRWGVTKGLGFRKETPLPPFMRQFDNKSASASDFKSK